MSVRKVSTASILSPSYKNSKIWDGITFPGYFESIATVIVPSGGASNIQFTNIPQYYTHLHIRGIAQDSGNGTTRRVLVMRLNGDTGSNYSEHNLIGNGTSASSGGNANVSYMTLGQITESGTNASNFGAAVIDIFDYTNTNKYKTVRSLGGNDTNGVSETGAMMFASGNWRSTNAVDSITLDLRGDLSGNFSQYSHFGLYGIRSA